MEDGISINIATGVVSAIFGAGGLAGILAAMGKFKGKGEEPKCSQCPEHANLISRINALEMASAANEATLRSHTELLKSIDRRLETLTNIFIKQKG